jgi:flagella basal body P-ring formation protein FlgA
MGNETSTMSKIAIPTLFALSLLPVCSQAQSRPAGEKATDATKTSKAALLLHKPAGPAHHLTSKVTPKKRTEPEASTAIILVKANSEINSGPILLGDIASIQSKDKDLTAQLASVQVGVLPLPGMSRLVTPGDIIVHLRAANLGRLLESKRLELVAASVVRVVRAAHDVTTDEITKTAIESAQIALKNMPNATLELVSVNGKMTVPAGKVRVVAGAYRGDVESGTLLVPVSALVDGKIVQTTDVTLHVRRKSMIVVARRTLEPHDIVSESDLMLSTVDTPMGFTRPLLDLQEAVGKRMTRRVMADAPISAAWLETPPDITANAHLTIESVFGSVRITAPGLSRQAGMIGELIRVYALETHKDLEAIVVDSHTVRLVESE